MTYCLFAYISNLIYNFIESLYEIRVMYARFKNKFVNESRVNKIDFSNYMNLPKKNSFLVFRHFTKD